MRNRSMMAVMLSIAVTVPAGAQQQQGAAKSAAAKIASARSAAPASIASGATVAEFGANGTMTVLVHGTNGWLCVPDDPNSPGPDPMCLDKAWQDWMTAYMAKKTPPTKTLGIAYMLAGGSDASNTDPYAAHPAAGQSWITSGAHIMVIVPNAKLLNSYSSNANAAGPYVMWKGTPYAHLMLPASTGR